MATIRSLNEIILSLIDYFRIVQPDLDTKPGTLARDLFIEAPSSQLALLYDELSGISNKQSFRLVIGNELDQLAKNFSISRRQSTYSSGTALFTFSSLDAPVGINKNDIVYSSNGITFAVSNGVSILPSASNFYRSVATKYKAQLDLVGISDEYAAEVTVKASVSGAIGNIGNYYLNRTSIPGVSNVTNINSFNGGTDQEDDTSFRNRVLSSFSGSSVGTALGYLNAALSVDGVADAVVIEPGDTLMTRDGTEVRTNSDGSKTIISEGSGGKVDIIVLGSNLVENTDSYIYIDKSNSNDPISSKNNIVLGQISGDENKTINRKRLDNIANGILPKQPVENLLQVTGSISGSNFKEKTVDSYGRISGNYELIKDTGAYSGSPWSFDTFHWVSDKISLFQEDRVKSQFNGQDVLSFTGVNNISTAQQFISINNENSTVTYDRSVIQLLHYPVTNVTRVFNVNTGERYLVTNQNLDSTGVYNQTGRIKISGNTLPSQNDILQVDYSWVIYYDQHSDFDGLENTFNPRSVTDSIDWGYSSVIKDEEIWFEKDSTSNFFVGTTSHPISSIVSAKTFLSLNKYAYYDVSLDRIVIELTNCVNPAESIDSVKTNSNIELYNTSQTDGSFINETTVVGSSIFYKIKIILPTDTPISLDTEQIQEVTVYLNSTEVLSSTIGSFNGTQITIPVSSIDTTQNFILLKVTYIANVSDLFSSAITSLPTSRIGNGFSLLNNNGFNNFSITNLSRRESLTIQQNLSSQFYVELSINNTDSSLLLDQIVSVVRLSDGAELWNSNNQGSISIGTSGNYQLILSGYNTPALGNKCLVVYYSNDIRRFQPFSYSNTLLSYRIDTLQYNSEINRFYLKKDKYITQSSGLSFKVFEPNTNPNDSVTDNILFSITDGYIHSDGYVGSLTVNFSTQVDLLYKKIYIYDATNPNNNGIYDITSYSSYNNVIYISKSNISLNDQISIIRLSDSKEIWNYSGQIDQNGNLILPENITANTGDKVFLMYYNFKNLRKSPTMLSCNIVDQITNTGIISVYGTTIAKASNIIFTAESGLKQNLSEAVRKALNLSSTTSIPSNIKLAKLVKLEKVTTVSSNSEEVLTVDATYDVLNTKIQNNLLYPEMISLSTLSNLEFTLPSTQNNTLNLAERNLPQQGDKMRVTFYYTTEGDIENLYYTRNGILFTNKKFAFINKMYVSSGFRNSQSTRFTVTSFNQPTLGSRYKVFYDYYAPKQNERISIKYNYNQLIADATFNIENTRPINADVLIKAAKTVLLDLTMNVVIDPNYYSSETNVLQELRNQLIISMTAVSLGTIIDTVTLINVAQSVQGISRARILYFNKTGNIGQVLKIQAQKDEYLVPNNIVINTEYR